MSKQTAEKIELREGQYVFRLLNKIKPNIEGAPPYQPKKTLPETNIVWDDETNRVRSVRVVDGVGSIFVDEQIESKIDQKWAQENAWSPTFINGVCTLNFPQDEAKIRAMMLLDGFNGKARKRTPGAVAKFELVNNDQLAASDFDYFAEKKKASDRAFAAIKNFESIKAHAQYLGIAFKDGIRDRTEKEITTDYLRKADTDPVTFNKHFDNPLIELSFLIRTAVTNGTIDITSSKGEAKWGDTKTTICKLDLTKADQVDSIVEFATSPDGKKFIDKLKQLSK